MFNRNRIELTGNIVQAAHTTAAGEATVTHARIIYSESVASNGGDPVTWLTAIDLEIWGRRGKAFAKHVTTKTPIYIEGRLQLDQWESDGKRRSKLFIRVSDWQFLASKQPLKNTPQA